MRVQATCRHWLPICSTRPQQPAASTQGQTSSLLSNAGQQPTCLPARELRMSSTKFLSLGLACSVCSTKRMYSAGSGTLQGGRR